LGGGLCLCKYLNTRLLNPHPNASEAKQNTLMSTKTQAVPKSMQHRSKEHVSCYISTPPTNLHTHACKAKSTTQQIGTNNNSNKTTHKDDEQQNTKATRKYL